jgi:hypothetical protein
MRPIKLFKGKSMSVEFPQRFIAGDVGAGYVFRYTSGGYEDRPISEDLLPRQIQRLAQDIADIDTEIVEAANAREKAERDFAERKADLEKGFAAIQAIVAEFSPPD